MRMSEKNRFIELSISEDDYNILKKEWDSYKEAHNGFDCYLASALIANRKEIQSLKSQIDEMKIQLDLAYFCSHKDVATWTLDLLKANSTEKGELDLNGFTDDMSDRINGFINSKINENHKNLKSQLEAANKALKTSKEIGRKLANHNADMSEQLQSARAVITLISEWNFTDLMVYIKKNNIESKSTGMWLMQKIARQWIKENG